MLTHPGSRQPHNTMLKNPTIHSGTQPHPVDHTRKDKSPFISGFFALDFHYPG